MLEHYAVYTQGQAGKSEHILDAGDIPVVLSDRGGQVTYHGPGQLIVYFLADLQRNKLNIRDFIDILESSVIELLAGYKIVSNSDKSAPGVYVDKAKICSIGLRVRHGCTYHGLSLNVTMDLEPFTRISPCGHKGLRMAQLSDYVNDITIEAVVGQLLPIVQKKLNYTSITM